MSISFNTNTIGGLCNLALVNGKSAAETLAIAKSVYPTGSTTLKCIYYYASKLRGAGYKVAGFGTAREINETALAKAMKDLKPIEQPKAKIRKRA